MSDNQGNPEDRRADTRHIACFPAEIEVEGSEGEASLAMIRDLSVSGALLFARSKLKVGSKVKLSLYILDETNPRVVRGQIMRCEKRSQELVDMWSISIGVKFDELLKDYEAEVKAVAEQQAKLGISKAEL